MMPRANANGNSPTQYPLTRSGATATMMISRSGPAYLPTKLSDAVSSTLLVEPASRLSPWGVMARSSAPPQPSVSPTRPRRMRL